jgi:hypothetical protein
MFLPLYYFSLVWLPTCRISFGDAVHVREAVDPYSVMHDQRDSKLLFRGIAVDAESVHTPKPQ